MTEIRSFRHLSPLCATLDLRHIATAFDGSAEDTLDHVRGHKFCRGAHLSQRTGLRCSPDVQSRWRR